MSQRKRLVVPCGVDDCVLWGGVSVSPMAYRKTRMGGSNLNLLVSLAGLCCRCRPSSPPKRENVWVGLPSLRLVAFTGEVGSLLLLLGRSLAEETGA